MINAIRSRACNATLGTASTVCVGGLQTIATVIGVAATPLSIITAGQLRPINAAANYVRASRHFLPLLFTRTLSIINPNLDSKYYELELKDLMKKSSLGLITHKFTNPLFKLAREESKTDSFKHKHVISRGAYLLGAIISVITRTADLILGLCALPLALVTCGSYRRLNDFVFDQLQFFSVIGDVCGGMRGFVNPQQFTGEDLVKDAQC